MSYILDALRKSEQQRQRGAMPTLPTAPVTVAARRQPMHLYYGLLACVLLAAGVAIGWLQPWAEQPAPEHVAVKQSIQISQLESPTPLPVPPETAKKAAPEIPAPETAAQAQKPETSLPAAAGTANAAAPVPERPAEQPAAPEAVAQGQGVMAYAELPLQIQQEIPAMTVQLHAYSSIPSERLVSINSVRLREGGTLAPGLALEQITPEGMIFSFRGYRFLRRIR